MRLTINLSRFFLFLHKPKFKPNQTRWQTQLNRIFLQLNLVYFMLMPKNTSLSFKTLGFRLNFQQKYIYHSRFIALEGTIGTLLEPLGCILNVDSGMQAIGKLYYSRNQNTTSILNKYWESKSRETNSNVEVYDDQSNQFSKLLWHNHQSQFIYS